MLKFLGAELELVLLQGVKGLFALDDHDDFRRLHADLQAEGRRRQGIERRIGPAAAGRAGQHHAVAALAAEEKAALDKVGDDQNGAGVTQRAKIERMSLDTVTP